MKIAVFLTLIVSLTFQNCKQNNQSTKSESQTNDLKITDYSQDKEEIRNLMFQVLEWADSKESISLLPMITNSNDSIYIEFDFDILNENLDKLKKTNFFASEFIENYNQIILALDKGLKSGEYEQWLVGDLPTFIFANDANPWCMCQDTPSKATGDLEVIKIDKVSGELFWKWGADSDWIDFRIRVIKENDKWKIAYLQGFDFKESTRKDGVL